MVAVSTMYIVCAKRVTTQAGPTVGRGAPCMPLRNTGQMSRDTLTDGRSFENNPQVKVLGGVVGKKGSAMAALNALEQADTGVWSKHHKQVCGGRIPLGDRTTRLDDAAGAAFLFGSGGPCSPMCGAWSSRGRGCGP